MLSSSCCGKDFYFLLLISQVEKSMLKLDTVLCNEGGVLLSAWVLERTVI